MEINLDPQDWRSDRPKPREPFFGPGLPSFILTMALLVAVAYVKRYWLNF